MNAARVVLAALVAYNAGGADWRAVVGSACLWAAVEAGVAYQTWHDRRDDEAVAKIYHGLRVIESADPGDLTVYDQQRDRG